MWRVLHRAVDLIAHSRDAARQAGGNSVCSTVAGLPLRALRQAGAAGGLLQPSSAREHVRSEPGRCDPDARNPRVPDAPVTNPSLSVMCRALTDLGSNPATDAFGSGSVGARFNPTFLVPASTTPHRGRGLDPLPRAPSGSRPGSRCPPARIDRRGIARGTPR